MVAESVEAVRQAEIHAAHKKAETDSECNAILQKAKQQAEDTLTSLTNEALAKRHQNLERAHQQEKAILNKADQLAKQKSENIQKMADVKEHDAIQLILSEII